LTLFELEKGFDINLLNTIQDDDRILFMSFLRRLKNGAMSCPLPEIFVKPKHGVSLEDLISKMKNSSITFSEEYPYMENVYIFKQKKFPNLQDLERLKESDLVKYATRNMLFTPKVTSVNDSLFDFQWSILNDGTLWNGTADADMDVDQAWAKTTSAPYIRIAILDSGTDTNHVDLKVNLDKGFDATGGSQEGYPNTVLSSDGHGTACAGIVAAKGNNNIGTAGIAYNSTIIPVRIFFYINFSGQQVPFATTASGADGVNWATDSAQADILSNSWGLGDAEITQLGIDTAFSNDVIKQAILRGRHGKGLITLFSSGNDADTFSIWPAALPQTISVGATSMCDELKSSSDCSSENWGSNHNLGLDVTAPGVRIATSDMTGSLGYGNGDYTLTFNGTSAACPNAAGVAGLILSIDTNFSGEMVREILSKSCDKVGGYNYGSNEVYGTWSKELGYGRVNAYQAVLRAEFTSNSIENNDLEELQVKFRSNGNQTFVDIHSEFFGKHNVTIYDLLGKLIYADQVIMDTGSAKSIVFASETKGVYIVNVIKDQHSVTEKFIH
jgi:subtilisin family serine protease